jgi:hypothetical protein
LGDTLEEKEIAKMAMTEAMKLGRAAQEPPVLKIHYA